MSIIKVDYGTIITNSSSGTFASQTGQTLTITVSSLSQIDTVTWRMPDYPTYFGYAKKYGTPYNDTVIMSYDASKGGLFPSNLGVQSISGNTFTFRWGGNQNFEYTVFGS